MKAIVANGISFEDSDIVNIDDYDPEPGIDRAKPFLFHDHGFTLAVVLAPNLQDALDIAVDAGKLTRYHIEEFEKDDYTEEDMERMAYLGNDCLPHDIETLGVHELKNPPMSFCALYMAAKEKA